MSRRFWNAGASEAPADGRVDETNSAPGQEGFAMSIDVVARMFKVPTITLRYCELRGLIARERVGDICVYSWSQCERIALIVKARRAGMRIRDLRPVVMAMDEAVTRSVSESGRRHCISLIHVLEDQQQALGNVLGELYRIDWELSARLGVDNSGGADDPADA
jgi:DNA-binding transcriptional MerR regulator